MDDMNSEHDQDDDALDDRELPDPSDMDQDGEDDLTDTEPCPHCNRPIYSQAEFCHYCGKAVTWEHRPSPKILWLFTALILILILATIWAML